MNEAYRTGESIPLRFYFKDLPVISPSFLITTISSRGQLGGTYCKRLKSMH